MSSSTTTAPSCQPLASVFRDVTDPRDRRGVRHDPPTILCLGCDGDPATYITRSSRTTRRSPLAIRARTAVRLMDVAAAILGGRNVRRPHRIPPPSMTNASPPPDPEGYSGVVRVVLVGLVGLAGAGACPNLPQRRPAARSAANETAEYQRFSSGVPARSGSLWQIWTRPRPGSSQESHQHHSDDPRITFPLRPFPFTTLLCPLLYEKKGRSRG